MDTPTAKYPAQPTSGLCGIHVYRMWVDTICLSVCLSVYLSKKKVRKLSLGAVPFQKVNFCPF